MIDGIFALQTSKETVPDFTIENIDFALYTWVDDQELFCTTNSGYKKTKVKWVMGERSHQSKSDSEMRDSSGALILPMITVERTRMTKELNKKGGLRGCLFCLTHL